MASPGEGAGAAAATQAHAPGGMDVSSLARVLPSELPTVTAESLPKWTPQDLAAQNPFQLGNFTPVDGDACYPSPHLTVVGSIPPDIDGLYLRNGTNQRFHPPAGPIHMFDGDAMLHTVRLSNGQALYYARSWITTERARANISAGKDLFPVTYGLLTAGGMSALMTLAGWRKALESDEGHPARVDYPFNPSTNTLYIGGKMFAEVEVAPPLQISINPSTGQVDAVGDFDNFGDERLAAFTAHHKICPRTGELYFFGLPKYSPPPKRVPPSPTATADSAPAGPPEHGEGNLQPQGGVDGGHASEAASGAASPAAPVQSQDDVVLFGVLTPQGELAHLTRFPLASPPGVQSPLLLHDYFLTENYAVVVDHSMRMDIGGMAQGRPAPVWDDRCKIRFGVCPRRPAGPHDIRWLSDNATCGFLWHIVNGWEETHTRDGGVKETVLTLFFCMFESYPGSVPIHLSEEPPSHLTKWTLNLATGQVAHQRVAATCGAAMERNDINRAYLGHPGSRFAYLMRRAEALPMYDGFVKVDLKNCTVAAVADYGPHRLGGEALFVARKGAVEEDDGYLMDIVHDHASGKSELCIWDAKQANARVGGGEEGNKVGEGEGSSPPQLALVARVVLPARVPFGVHGNFLTAKDLDAQHRWFLRDKK
eukprot:jgi/Mesvir1/2105/Mv16636-RA.2